MADTYSNALLAAGKKAPALLSIGTECFVVVGIANVLAADGDGEVYRIFKDIPSNAVPIAINVWNTAITSGTDYDLGLYKANLGAVVDKDILCDGTTMASARTVATLNNVGMTTINIAQSQKTLGELSAQTDVDSAYDIAWTANTVGSADGTITAVGIFAYR
jgi:hypothetical protein